MRPKETHGVRCGLGETPHAYSDRKPDRNTLPAPAWWTRFISAGQCVLHPSKTGNAMHRYAGLTAENLTTLKLCKLTFSEAETSTAIYAKAACDPWTWDAKDTHGTKFHVQVRAAPPISLSCFFDIPFLALLATKPKFSIAAAWISSLMMER